MTEPFFLAETYFNEHEKDLDKVESAWAKAALALRTGMRFGHIPGHIKCLSIVKVHDQLDVFKKRYEKGDTLALLHAIRYCGEENMPLPTWLALDFNKRFSEFLQPDGPVSLDEVFSSKKLPQSGKRAVAARRDWQTGLKIWNAVWEIAEDHPSLDSALNAVLEKGNHDVEKTKARALVTMIDENQEEFLGGKHRYKGLRKYFSQKK
ncbi:hypothetical protein SAMN05216412_101347 [Nitrosospira multiformis]|uniref:Uncharacterized protein n=1 Tax=Nitrosospira multiformis TaxID=1231 RepID=A0A1H9YR88_9PROT|nr:hypothetical protein [Nitrosospira multiformis]SES71677.1 hypothetical protein SAMN05216412_101347 [Nitrosospira multiformis]